MPEAGEVVSNLKRSPNDYDVDLPTPVIDDPLPYTDTSSAELMDEEARLFAQNYAMSASQRWPGQERWMGRENEEMRVVNIMHPHTIFKKLKDAGVDCSIEPQLVKVWGIDHKTGLAMIVEQTRGNARFWLHDLIIQDRVGISAWVWQDGERTARYITYLQVPGPEWSVMRFNDYDVPTSEKYRGWRTAMLALIKAGVLAEGEVHKAFGEPPHSEVSQLYHEQLARLREQRGKL